MMRTLIIAITVVALSVVANASFIDPTFTGAAGSTMQQWDFDTPANPVVAETFVNPFGDPTATIIGDPLDMQYIAVDTNTGRTGVWKTKGHYEFHIDNTDQTGPDTYKDVVIQMIYDSDPFDDLVWMRYSADGSPIALGTLPDTKVALGDGYSLATWTFQIKPNPTEETIYLLPYYCNLYVDSVRIDTVCVPEPASMGIMGIGALLMFARKRK
jgi:hypothetical protein